MTATVSVASVPSGNSKLTVMVADPAATPVIWPLPFTVAFVASDELYEQSGVTLIPLLAETSSCVLEPAATEAVAGVASMLVGTETNPVL